MDANLKTKESAFVNRRELKTRFTTKATNLNQLDLCIKRVGATPIK